MRDGCRQRAECLDSPTRQATPQLPISRANAPLRSARAGASERQQHVIDHMRERVCADNAVADAQRNCEGQRRGRRADWIEAQAALHHGGDEAAAVPGARRAAGDPSTREDHTHVLGRPRRPGCFAGGAARGHGHDRRRRAHHGRAGGDECRGRVPRRRGHPRARSDRVHRAVLRGCQRDAEGGRARAGQGPPEAHRVFEQLDQARPRPQGPCRASGPAPLSISCLLPTPVFARSRR